MGELAEYLKERYFSKNKSQVQDQMNRQQTKIDILNLCDQYVTEAGVEFTFEALPKALPYVAIVIEEEPLKSKYDIYQVSETLFSVRLKELDLL